MKLCLVIDPKNKYETKLYYGNRLIASGSNGLDDVHLITKGKRTIAVVSLTDFELVVESENCPELYHYGDIRANKGNQDGLKRVGYSCDLLEISATACEGCRKNPDTLKEQFTATNTKR